MTSRGFRDHARQAHHGAGPVEAESCRSVGAHDVVLGVRRAHGASPEGGVVATAFALLALALLCLLGVRAWLARRACTVVEVGPGYAVLGNGDRVDLAWNPGFAVGDRVRLDS